MTRIIDRKADIIGQMLIVLLTLMLAPNTLLAENKTSQVPVYAFKIVLETVSDHSFDDVLRTVSDRMGMALRTEYTDPKLQIKFTQMWRDDLRVIIDNTYHPATFTVYLYSLGLVPKDAERQAQLDFIREMSAAIEQIGLAKVLLPKSKL